MTKMCPVVHFEMPYEQRDRIAKFYESAFGWQLQMHLTGGELGAAAVLALTAALAGAIYPAWRCARAPVIAGLRTE